MAVPWETKIPRHPDSLVHTKRSRFWLLDMKTLCEPACTKMVKGPSEEIWVLHTGLTVKGNVR